MATKTEDPVKRTQLLAARSILLGIDTLTTFARMDAASGGSTAAAKKIEKARDLLFEANLDIEELLAVN